MRASGSWGCGAYTRSGEWLQLKWPIKWNSYHITVRKLLPFVLAIPIWGKRWQGRFVRCWCDTAAVVVVLRDQGGVKTSMRCTCWKVCTSSWQLSRSGLHLSILRAHETSLQMHCLIIIEMCFYLSELSSTQQVPTMVPSILRQLPVDYQVDCMSRVWGDLLSSTLIKDYPPIMQ